MLNNEIFDDIKDFELVPKIQQPINIRRNLYPHQLASVYNMEKLEISKQINITDSMIIDTTIGINADKVGYGKCNGYNTPIIMFNGTIKMVQDIKVGDLLMGDNSTSRKVLSLCQGYSQMYNIIQNIGENYIVNKNHILSLIFPNQKSIKRHNTYINTIYIDPYTFTFMHKKFSYSDYNFDKCKTFQSAKEYLDKVCINPKVDISISEYLLLSADMKSELRGYKSCIDCWENKLDEEDLDSYFIGSWLGNVLDNSLSITSDEIELVEYFTNLNKKKIMKCLQKHNLLNNKHIPYKYKTNDKKNRLKLLAGLLDAKSILTNGTYEIVEKNCSVLSEDINFLCGSLGFRCVNKKIYKKDKKGNINIYTKISISGNNINEIPLKVIRKKCKKLILNNNQLYTQIKVQPIGIDKYYGFTLDENHRYLLRDFTVTHNSLSMIALINRNTIEWDLKTPYILEQTNIYGGGKIKRRRFERFEKVKTTLILAGQSLIHQWVNEISYTDLKIEIVSSRKVASQIEVFEYDVIIVTPSMYNILLMSNSNIAWKRFIYDEPGDSKVTSMHKIVAGFYWFVTATPYSIVDMHKKCRLSFMHDIFCSNENYNFEYDFNPLIIKNSEDFINYSFKMPLTEHFNHKCINNIYSILNGIASTTITNLISSGDIQEAFKLLGGKSSDNLTELVLKKKEQELHLIQTEIKIAELRCNTELVLDWTDRETKLKTQIRELEIRYSELLNGDCNICFEKIENPVLEPNCQNVFCGSCILKWLQTKQTCPLCRHEVKYENLILERNRGYSVTETKNTNDIYTTKENKIAEIINNNPTDKIIIFSDRNNSFTSIRNILTENNIKFNEVKGSISTRENILNNFRTGDTQVIFLNSNYEGSGINLKEADTIIVYSDLSPNKLSQVIGRANRIGRIKPLKVHHLIL